MDIRVQQFRHEAAARGAGRVGGRYGKDLRRLAVALAAERTARGGSVAELAAELGVCVGSLRRWQETILAEVPASGFRPVAVQVESGGPSCEAAGGCGLALVTPRGYRIEGLDRESVAWLLGRLG
jgi:transposase